MGSCGTRPSTTLNAAQRRLIIITVPASIMKVRARARVRVHPCTCVCVYCVGVESARVLAAWLHSGTSGGRDPTGRTSGGGAKRDGEPTTRVASRRTCCVSAPLSHALKRNAWGLHEGRTEGSERRSWELRAGIFIFSGCASPDSIRTRFPKDRIFFKLYLTLCAVDTPYKKISLCEEELCEKELPNKHYSKFSQK